MPNQEALCRDKLFSFYRDGLRLDLDPVDYLDAEESGQLGQNARNRLRLSLALEAFFQGEISGTDLDYFTGKTSLEKTRGIIYSVGEDDKGFSLANPSVRRQILRSKLFPQK